jgi:hypothetical protein
MLSSLFKYTNQMHTIYLINTYTILFLRVSVYLTPYSGRTYVLLKTICFYKANVYGTLVES